MKKAFVLLIVICLFISSFASADTFGTGDNQFEIEFVIIGCAGNAGEQSRLQFGDTAYYGAVFYEYRIGKYEVTNTQWKSFVAAVGVPTGNYRYAYDSNFSAGGLNCPANGISWYEAAQFCNYLTSGDKSQGAYLFNGDNINPGDFIGIDRDLAVPTYDVVYVLPTENEWYKAAYYKPDGSGYSKYANGLDTNPVSLGGWNISGSSYGSLWDVGSGTIEQNYTFDMMGNVQEWNETPYNPMYLTSNRGLRGGTYYTILGIPGGPSSLGQGFMWPSFEDSHVGFRVVSIVPGPPTIDISFDVKPQSCPNPVNVKSKGVLPVAVLGSEVFDVNEIDPNSVEILGIQPIRYNYEDVAAPADVNALPEECLCSTDGPDGYPDMTLKFDTPDIIEAIGEVRDSDTVILTLTGSLKDGTPIEGTDCVTIIKKGKD